MDRQSVLRDLRPQHEYFIGIDSDGCVFDSMDVKHREFFIPAVIRHFGLFAVARQVRETWEFVNLRSVTRGINRFPALIRVFDLLRTRKDVVSAGIEIPELSSLRSWIREESRLGNSTLKAFYGQNPDPEIGKVLTWSEGVNDDINRWLRDLPPFVNARKSIENAAGKADIIVVSQTPTEALDREWEEHRLKTFVRAIAGQESGTKTEHLSLASHGKYPPGKILMIGDAPGDLKAAQDNGALFYPILAGGEEKSWKDLVDEGLNLFFSGNFSGTYQENLLEEFRKSLPEFPHWE